MKATCVFFSDWFSVAQEIEDEALRCKLYDAILRFALDGTETPTLPSELTLLFASIKLQVGRTNEQYDSICAKRAEAGRRGAQVTNEIRWGSQTSAKSANADNCRQVSANVGKIGLNKNKNKNENENENEKIDNASHAATIEQRKQSFYETLLPYREQYDASLLENFFSYWTELGRTNKKLRFELERTFEVGKRLARWASNDNNFNNRQA